jgi:hypothetical protein
VLVVLKPEVTVAIFEFAVFKPEVKVDTLPFSAAIPEVAVEIFAFAVLKPEVKVDTLPFSVARSEVTVETFEFNVAMLVVWDETVDERPSTTELREFRFVSRSVMSVANAESGVV